MTGRSRVGWKIEGRRAENLPPLRRHDNKTVGSIRRRIVVLTYHRLRFQGSGGTRQPLFCAAPFDLCSGTRITRFIPRAVIFESAAE